eukprot:GEMP01111318.1.p1 GENE.GEMP01111318.1~~GEMP01111318.1.p1  ORF type:complete len:129 (+),score=38.27 GEMP01111318.1:264-650(+)
MVDEKGLAFAKYGDGTRPQFVRAGFDRAHKDQPVVSAEDAAAQLAQAQASAVIHAAPTDANGAAVCPKPRSERSRSPRKDTANDKDKKAQMSIKDRTKIKRIKGQSGEEHAGRTWKPDEWMKMRQEFD